MSYTRKNAPLGEAPGITFADPFPPGEPPVREQPSPRARTKAANPSRGEQAAAGRNPFPSMDHESPDSPETPSPSVGTSAQGRVAEYSRAYREKLSLLDPEERAALRAETAAKAAASRRRNQSIVERAEIMMNCALRGKAADKVRELYPDLGNDVYFMDAALAGLLAKLPKGDVGAWGLVLRLFGEDKLRITGPNDDRDDIVVTFVGRRKDKDRKDRKPIIDVTPRDDNPDGNDNPDDKDDA